MPTAVEVAEPAVVLAVEQVAEPAEALVVGPVEAGVEVLAAAPAAADCRVHSGADWIRATRSRHRRNPQPASPLRVRTRRPEALSVGCSPHIKRLPTATVPSCDGEGCACAGALSA